MKLIALLFPYRTHLEEELKQQRTDFERQLAEKNLEIRKLRVALAGTQQQTADPLPHFQSVGTPVSTAKPAEVVQDWQTDLNKLLKEEEDGIRARGIQEHEPRTDDGA